MNDNLRKYAQLRGLTKGTGLALSKLTGIDKSTVSLHLTGHRKMTLDHARKYAESLDVPLIKIIDDKSVKYPVVGYVNDDGTVRMRSENEIEVIVTDNHIESSGNYCLIQKSVNIAYFYNTEISCENSEVINEYCYIKNKKKQNLLGDIQSTKKVPKKSFNRHIGKNVNIDIDICYPIVSIHFLNHSKVFKIQGEY